MNADTLTIDILENVDLNAFNTLAVPSACAFFVVATKQDELIEAISWARSKNIELYILGGGSNALLPEFIDGLVVHVRYKGISHTVSDNKVFVTAAAGENWHDFVCFTLQNNWFGLENLSLIPGSVGAAPIQNIGAYGVELSDRFYSVKILDLETLDERVLYKKDCGFAYRESIFKSAEGKEKFIILSVCFELSLHADINIGYPALKQQITQDLKSDSRALESVHPQYVANAVISIRQSKLPAPKDIPNVGSFFKNPRLRAAQLEDLKKRFPEMPSYLEPKSELKSELENIYKIPAAWLIDQRGWKGRFIGGVGVHDKQALVLVNPNRESISKVLALSKLIQQDVYNCYGVSLEIEPQILSTKL